MLRLQFPLPFSIPEHQHKKRFLSKTWIFWRQLWFYQVYDWIKGFTDGFLPYYSMPSGSVRQSFFHLNTVVDQMFLRRMDFQIICIFLAVSGSYISEAPCTIITLQPTSLQSFSCFSKIIRWNQVISRHQNIAVSRHPDYKNLYFFLIFPAYL